MSAMSREQTKTTAAPEGIVVRVGRKTVVLPVQSFEKALDLFAALIPFGDGARLATPGEGMTGSVIFEYDGIVASSRIDSIEKLAGFLEHLFRYFAVADSFDHPAGGSFVHVRTISGENQHGDYRFFLRVELREELHDKVLAWLNHRAEGIREERWRYFLCD